MRNMTKSAMVLMTAVVMAFGIVAATGTTVIANDNAYLFGNCRGGGCSRGTGGMMWDEDGNFLTREAFEERLDTWIADGLVRSGDREFMLERFDWCLNYGGGATGARNFCRGLNGNGRGGNFSRWN